MATFTPNEDDPDIIHVRLSTEEIANSPNSPIDNIEIRRYMSIDKFKNLLKTNSIWFSRLDCFSDLHEGRAIIDWQNQDRLDEWWRTYVLASCWNWEKDENYSLWNIYLRHQLNTLWAFFLNLILSLKQFIFWLVLRRLPKNTMNGVCIVSTRDDFMNSIIDKNEEILNFFMSYIPYGNYFDLVDPILCATRKFDWYIYEREFRFIIYLGYKFPLKGMAIKIDPNILVRNIILSPNIQKRARNKVFKLAKEHGINVNLIADSKILDKLY